MRVSEMWKAVFAFVIAGTGSLAQATALDNSISMTEWLIASNVAFAAFVGVYFVVNAAPKENALTIE